MNKLCVLSLQLYLLFSVHGLISNIEISSASGLQNQADQNWEILFDGTSFDHFRGYLSDEMFPEWSISGDAMLFTPSNKNRRNIITKKTYTNFVLSLEWKVERGGNSGIFWSVIENNRFPEAYDTGPEVQVLDNEHHPDARYKAGTRTVAYPKAHVNPAGEWNLCVLSIDHEANQGSVTMNGNETISFPLRGANWNQLVSHSKFKDWKGFRKQYTGHIGLQDHGDKVWFRNIKIKVLD